MSVILEPLHHHLHQLVPVDPHFHHHHLQLPIHQFLELLVNHSVFEFILFFVCEFLAVLVNELLNRDFPDRRSQVLQYIFINPLVFFLHFQLGTTLLALLGRRGTLLVLLFKPTEHIYIYIKMITITKFKCLAIQSCEYNIIYNKYNYMFDSKINANKRQTHISTINNINIKGKAGG